MAQDHELAGRILAGEAAAEAELSERFRPGLMAIAQVRLGGDRSADLVQDVLIVALENLRAGRWRGDGPLGAYLASILRRKITRERAAVAAEPLPDQLAAPVPEATDPLARVGRMRARERVRTAVAQLSRRHRDVVVRHYLEGESVDQVARALGIPRGTVLSRLHHARRKLARALNQVDRWRNSKSEKSSLERA